MRKISFRGRRIDNNEWVYGYLFSNTKFAVILEYAGDKTENEAYYHQYAVIPETVGQYID